MGQISYWWRPRLTCNRYITNSNDIFWYSPKCRMMYMWLEVGMHSIAKNMKWLARLAYRLGRPANLQGKSEILANPICQLQKF